MNFFLSKDEVIFRINNILEERFGVDPKLIINDEDRKKNLLGGKFGFTPRELLYLFFEIENEFNIHIEDDDVISEKFNNIEGIVSTVLIRSKQKDPV